MRTYFAWALAALAALAAAAGSALTAGEKGMKLKVGDRAPAFQAVDDQGRLWKSGDHVGKNVVVVWFYPAALTGG